MRVDANEFNLMHYASLLVQMDPRDKHPNDPEFALREPDLILTLDKYSFEANQFVLEGLQRGDYIIFNATITHLGIQ